MEIVGTGKTDRQTAKEKGKIEKHYKECLTHASRISHSFNAVETIFKSCPAKDLPFFLAKVESHPRGALLIKMMALLLNNK